MVDARWITGIVIFGLFILVLVFTFKHRSRISRMASMMIAMTLGMSVGLTVGTLTGIQFSGNLFGSTILSMMIGATAGFAGGAAGGAIAVLDGVLSGIMGGMMGAMLGDMIPYDKGALLVRVLLVLFVFVTLTLLYMMVQENGREKASTAETFFMNPFLLAPVLIGFFLFYRQIEMPLAGYEHPSAHLNREIKIMVSDYQYSPNQIDLRAGETVTLTVHNMGKLDHDLTIKELGISLHAAPEETRSVIFSTPQKGEYPFSCTIPGHAEKGLVGSVTIK